MSKCNYSTDFKLMVVKEYITGDFGCRAIAKKYNLPSKNYVFRWRDELIKLGLIENTVSNIEHKGGNKKNISKNKTAYEKQLEKENFELKAKLAYFNELQKLVDESKKK